MHLPCTSLAAHHVAVTWADLLDLALDLSLEANLQFHVNKQQVLELVLVHVKKKNN